MRLRVLLPSMLVTAVVLSLLGAPMAAAQTTARTIVSSGPLNRIEVTGDLNCAVERGGINQFYSDTACGTFLSYGGNVYGPQSVPAGPSAPSGTYMAWTPVSQSSVTGGGTAADPFRVITEARAGDTGVRVRQVVTYVTGSSSVMVAVELIGDASAAGGPAVLYHAGDCYFGGNDRGFGREDAANRSVACVEALEGDAGSPAEPGEGEIRWTPQTRPEEVSWYEAGYSQVWTAVQSGNPFPNTCRCDEYIDNGAGIAWSTMVAPGATTTHNLDLSLTQSVHEPPAVASTEGGSVMVDPRSNTLVIAFPPTNRTDVTLTTSERCADDTVPTGVTLAHGVLDGSGNMPPPGPPPGSFQTAMQGPSGPNGDSWGGAIPAGELRDGGVIEFLLACPGGSESILVGRVNLYDPSGFVTDIFTGAPVPGATVVLYIVPGWRPRAAGEAENTPDTCQSGQSKASPDDPWTQVAPEDLGRVVDPYDSATPVSPSVNPFITDARGHYGWDVPEGCFFVRVSHERYNTLVSPVVGVPPEVLDLDLQVIPLSTQGYPASAVNRLRGSGRTQTAAAISAATFPTSGVPVAYVATQGNFPDALAGGPAAAIQGGPILLTARDAIPQATRDELARLRPARIVVLGGTGVISQEVQNALQALATSGEVTRISGPSRFDTAARISAATFPPSVRVAYIATGERFADALAGGGPAARNNSPVLLVQQNQIPAATVAELQRLVPKRIVVLGGTAAVSDAVMTQLRQYVAQGGQVTRQFGTDRFGTGAAIASTFPTPTPSVFIATGHDFPDALAGVPAAGRQRGAVILVTRDTIPAAAAAQLQRLRPYRIFVLGGEAVISAQVEAQLRQYLRS